MTAANTYPPNPPEVWYCWKPQAMSIWSRAAAPIACAPLATTCEFTRNCCAPGAPASVRTVGAFAPTNAGAFKVPKTAGPAWAHPVVCDGRLYLREGDLLFCYDVRARR